MSPQHYGACRAHHDLRLDESPVSKLVPCTAITCKRKAVSDALHAGMLFDLWSTSSFASIIGVQDTNNAQVECAEYGHDLDHGYRWSPEFSKSHLPRMPRRYGYVLVGTYANSPSYTSLKSTEPY